MKDNKLKLRRKRKSKTKESTSSLQPVKEMQCPQCKKMVPDYKIESIRGQVKCIKCHVENLWCYAEQNRKTQAKMIDELLSVDWNKGSKEDE